MSGKKITIALDGYSSCGKSTFSKQIAATLGYIYIDSGAMYRTATLYSLENAIIDDAGKVDEAKLYAELKNIHIDFLFNPEKQTSDTYLNGVNVEEKIRSLKVSNHVSEVSKLKMVRDMMVQKQREIGKNGGIVMDGRDIGTVVFPNAELKIFMTAQPNIRAMRRYNELKAKGQDVSMDEIQQNLTQRDLIDSTRAESPLKKADDALELDNSFMSPEQQMEWVINIIKTIK